LIALELIVILEDARASVVGPVGTVKEALKLIEESKIDAAFLDGNLHGEPVAEVAASLTRRNVPFCFVTGYGREHLPPAFANAPLIGKPFSPEQVLDQACNLASQPNNVVRLKVVGEQ